MKWYGVLFFLPAVAWAEVEPGNWELSVTTQMPGMAQPMGPITQTRCMSEENARDPRSVLGQQPGNCEFSNTSDSGGVLRFNVRCSGQFPMTGSGTVRYSGSTMEGDLDLSADSGGQKIAMKSHVTGRRVGPCS